MAGFATFDPIEIDIPFRGKEPATVRAVNVRTEFPKPTQRQRTALATALGREASDLSEDGCLVVARSVADPVAATNLLKAGGAFERYAGDSALTIFVADVELASLIILDQPRGADTPTAIPAPRVAGELDANGDPLSQMVYEFANWGDLKEHIKHSVDITLKVGQHLDTSILGSQVSKPILATVATIRIVGDPPTDQPTQEFDALVAADGNTRTVCSLAAALGGEFNADELPGAIADRMLRSIPSGADSLSVAHHKGRAAAHDEALERFYVAAGDPTNPDLVRFGQTCLIPAEIVIGFRRFGPQLGQRSFEFVDAVRSDVGQQHSLAKAWSVGAVNANVGGQAIARAVAEGVLDEELGAVAEGVESFTPPVTVTPVDGDPKTVSGCDSGLARAVWLVHALTQPKAFDDIKRHIRGLGGHKQVDKTNFARHIASTLWREWAPYKAVSHGNEAAAWRVGGAIPQALMGTNWEALYPVRWADLVPIARDTEDPRHENAKATLMVAGGLALIADGQILAASGSTEVGAEGQRYRRSQPPVLITELGTTEQGLWTLAHAADSFDSTRPASNAFSRGSAITAGSYSITFPSSADPAIAVTNEAASKLSFDRIRDIAGMRIQANSDDDPPPPIVDDRDRLVRLRTDLANRIDSARKIQIELEKLVLKRSDFRAIDDFQSWEELDRNIRKLAAAVTNWEPEEPAIDEDDEFLDETEGVEI